MSPFESGKPQGSDDSMDIDLARKRSHEESSSDDDLSSVASDDVAMPDAPAMNNITNIQAYFQLKPGATNTASSSLSTAKQPSSTPAQSSSTTPNKHKRLTDAERAAKASEEFARKKEKEDVRLAKLAEKAAADAERAAAKAKLEAEKAAAKAKLEAERATVKAKADAEKAAKQAERDEKKRKREEEERRIQEEKEKKERSQMRLNSFFKRPIPTKVPGGEVAVGGGTPEKTNKVEADKEMTDAPVVNDYQKTFKPFFVRNNVRMAPLPSQQLDAEAREAKTRIFTEYVQYKRGSDIQVTPFDAVSSLHLPRKPGRRGIMHPAVKQLVEQMRESEFGDPRGEQARKALAKIPVKTLFFSTDVRPAYCGTVTGPQTVYGKNLMTKVARKPTGQVLPNLAYDYDSEAEWFDDEMGEDIDLEDEEEEIDDEDDMDGFLDDSEDAGVARAGFSNSMEPESSGICFETSGGRATCPELNAYRMEFILQSVPSTGGFDPLSTEYWELVEKKAMAPPPVPPANVFEAIAGASEGKDGKEKVVGTLELKRPELLPEIKKTIVDNSKLSKLGLIDVLFHQIDGLTKGEAKIALDVLATKVGTGRVKQWTLREELNA